MSKGRFRPALAWSAIAVLIVMGLDLYVRYGDGTPVREAIQASAVWLLFWPVFALCIWLLSSWRQINAWVQEEAAQRASTRALGDPRAARRAPCPKCGLENGTEAVVCARCGTRFRGIEVTHFVEVLPGARESVPSVLYVVAVIASFVLGGVAVAVVGFVNQELLQSDLWLIGTFLFGAGGALFTLFALIGAWARRRSSAVAAPRRE